MQRKRGWLSSLSSAEMVAPPKTVTWHYLLGKVHLQKVYLAPKYPPNIVTLDYLLWKVHFPKYTQLQSTMTTEILSNQCHLMQDHTHCIVFWSKALVSISLNCIVVLVYSTLYSRPPLVLSLCIVDHHQQTAKSLNWKLRLLGRIQLMDFYAQLHMTTSLVICPATLWRYITKWEIAGRRGCWVVLWMEWGLLSGKHVSSFQQTLFLQRQTAEPNSVSRELCCWAQSVAALTRGG